MKVDTPDRSTRQNVSVLVPRASAFLFRVKSCGHARLVIDPTGHDLGIQKRILLIGMIGLIMISNNGNKIYYLLFNLLYISM